MHSLYCSPRLDLSASSSAALVFCQLRELACAGQALSIASLAEPLLGLVPVFAARAAPFVAARAVPFVAA